MELTTWQMKGKAADVSYLGASQLLVTAPHNFIGTSGSASLNNWVGEMCGTGFGISDRVLIKRFILKCFGKDRVE